VIAGPSGILPPLAAPGNEISIAQEARSLGLRGDFLFAADIPSAVTKAECRRLAELAQGRRVLEVGSFLGRSTIALASTAEVVHSVDFHPPHPPLDIPDSTLPAFMANIERYGVRHNIVVHVGLSQDILPALRVGWFDLVFIDGEHQREPVERDIADVLPHLKDGAMLAFHDYGVPGVQHAGGWDDFHVTEVVDELADARRTAVDVTDSLAVVQLLARARS
jgi:predicted O-methyltransferase YrrM